MKRALLMIGLVVVVAGAQAVPTAAILDDVATWTFLNADQQEQLTSAKTALQKGEWRRALEFNEKLLESAPATIYEAEPRLPVIVIRPAGSENRPAQKAVSGWVWKKEAAELALLSLDWEGAVRRATLIRDAVPEMRADALRLMAQARARQGRYVEAQKHLGEADRLDRNGRDEWGIWDQARLQTPEAKMWLDQIIGVGFRPTGSIGSGTLPGLGQVQADSDAPLAQKIEACLVLGDWASRSGESVLAASYYDRALKLATKRRLSGLLAVTLWKRVSPSKN